MSSLLVHVAYGVCIGTCFLSAGVIMHELLKPNATPSVKKSKKRNKKKK